eukprot:CAMPEP_0202874702 /NCGR_PEP_ID=MMETSP1391-20130828/25876_1 /ASSEMBLY_ACC=CAM_ASM_000867 /TAXON_ID=1034604 /ORGANISM="Chlamydomonas leiostraca, Strain SAG 11-49" /LENGTH=36 /DNA_ID= /DNA_START= /DNA_END= /DNA_ORIENTATION=
MAFNVGPVDTSSTPRLQTAAVLQVVLEETAAADSSA